MTQLLKALLCLTAALGLFFGAAPAVLAQATTGTLSGVVMDQAGGLVPGASVTAVHDPTGTRYGAVSQQDGHFSILNVRVGGPYTVTVSLPGFKEQQQQNVTVNLGEERSLSFRLALETVTETVIVTADVDSLISPSQTGPAGRVSADAIETLPTIARGIEDYARLSPYFVSAGGGDGSGANSLSVAGRNSRYNNVQIDGAVNNDLFGLADSGTPGGQTETQPVSIDAIQELQLVVSPYDVRQGGFSGGGVNAITRSGTNRIGGTAYYYFRSESLTGDGPNDRPLSKFDDKQLGASVGGPIKKDKIFFFVNLDLGRKDTPSGFSADGTTGTAWGRTADVDRVLAAAQSKYGYDPGGKAEFTRGTNNDKVFGRIDANLSQNHRLTIRHNYVKADNDIGFPSNTQYLFPDAFYNIKDTTNSTVAQLNSTFGSAANELRVTYQRIRDRRDGPSEFPAIRVDVADGGNVRLGRETFSTANELDQDIIELTDDITIPRGKHLFTIGTHNEFFEFRNLFIRDNYGSYRFSSPANFEAGLAQSYDYSFSATSDPKQAAKFSVSQLGFYAGDLWRLTGRLTLNYGVRVDIPIFGDPPTANPAAVANFGYATDVAPSPAMWSPRVGFNWDIGGDAKQQLRGGMGLFSGRTPYVWLSNQYGNTGIEFKRVGASFNSGSKIPFDSDPFSQPTTVTGAAAGSFTNEVDVVDPDYVFPQLFRMNVGYDRNLGILGLVGTVEMFYSKTIKDIAYANLNYKQTGTRPDGRPTYSRVNTSFSDVILLKNTDEGYQWTVSGKLERPFRNGLYAMASYLYGDAYSVNDGTSSQAASNWGNAYTTGDPNNVPMMRSRFATGHRITAALSKEFKFARRVRVLTALYYNGQSGRPYHFTINGDWNGDGRFTNDLLYVPANSSEVIVKNGTWEQLDAYINDDPALSKYRGKIMEKHAAWGPWTNSLDLKTSVGFQWGPRRAEINLDILNFLNMINSDWGVVDFATFGDLNPIRVSLDSATGKMVYDIGTITSTTTPYVKYDRDNLRSRWQAQLGFRVRF